MDDDIEEASQEDIDALNRWCEDNGWHDFEDEFCPDEEDFR